MAKKTATIYEVDEIRIHAREAEFERDRKKRFEAFLGKKYNALVDGIEMRNSLFVEGIRKNWESALITHGYTAEGAVRIAEAEVGYRPTSAIL